MNQPSADDAAALLAAQIADLARYRHIVEAQRAVLRMEDAGLLEIFTAEAEGVFADISAREVQLLSIRAAVQSDTATPRPDQHAVSLFAELERERAMAAAAAQNLAEQMTGEAGRVTVEMKRASEQLNAIVRGYGSRWGAPGPTLIDRRG
ncbi:MAG TPA: hypothetical protein VGM20_04665 [Gemmatimonadales bacterium]|jgi:hypothetical protein